MFLFVCVKSSGGSSGVGKYQIRPGTDNAPQLPVGGKWVQLKLTGAKVLTSKTIFFFQNDIVQIFY